MMKASHVHYNHDSGIVTAEAFDEGEKFTVTEEAAGIELVSGDDVNVRVDAGMTHIETLAPQPLLIRQEGETVKVLTARKPKAESAPGVEKAH